MQGISEDIILGSFFFLLFLLFGLMTYLVLRKGTSEINLTFSLATVFFMGGSLLCSLDFFARANLYTMPSLLGDIFPIIGTLLYIWAPFGIFLTAKFILHGIDSYKEPLPIGVLGFLGLVTIVFLTTSGGLVLLEGSEPGRGTWYGTIVISAVLILSLYYYYRVYISAPELRNQLIFLMGGIILGILSLISVLFSSGDPNILPMEFEAIFLVLINVGILVSAFAFTNIPQTLHLPKSRNKTMN